MNNYKRLTSLSVEDFAKWIDEYGKFDDSPWITWFSNKFCNTCPSVIIDKKDSLDKLGFELWYGTSTTCSYCEINNKCRYFPDMEVTPSNFDIIKMWLMEKTNI